MFKDTQPGVGRMLVGFGSESCRQHKMYCETKEEHVARDSLSGQNQ